MGKENLCLERQYISHVLPRCGLIPEINCFVGLKGKVLFMCLLLNGGFVHTGNSFTWFTKTPKDPSSPT